MLSLLRTTLPAEVLIDGMRVLFRIHPRARGLTLRHNPKKSLFVLSAPKRASRKSMIAFANENIAWMRKQVSISPAPVTLQPGDYLPLQGQDRLIVHLDAPGVHIDLTDQTIVVSCRLERFPRALQRFLQQHAQNVINELAYKKAAVLGRSIQSITLRDTTTRWGSCTHDGKLSFSWRLILAPQEIIDYVVGHEVAHLKVFNHSPRFWETCRTMTDHTTFGKHWLQQYGNALHQISIISNI